jgi:hypothetical protein
MKTLNILISVLLILTVSCKNKSKKESDFWNYRQVNLLKFSANNEYLVIAATKKNDDSVNSYNYDSLTKLFIFKNINKNNSNTYSWSNVNETDIFSAWRFENLYLINSKSVALALAQICLGGAHGLEEMYLYKIDTNGDLEYRCEPYEENGTDPDGTEHFTATVINDSTMTMERDLGTYRYSIDRNEINRTFISDVEKARNKGAIVAKYILSNNKLSAYEQSTFYLKVGQAIIFDGVNAKTNKAPMVSIYTDAWNTGFLSDCEADRLHGFTYTFNKTGEFHFLIETFTRNYNEKIKLTFTVVVSPQNYPYKPQLKTRKWH